MQSLDLDIIVTRGGAVESRHRVHAAVTNGNGALVGAARDPEFVTYWRSCAKPFQLMPFVASGCFDRLGWTAEEMALACGSHGGEPEHVAIAARMLAAVGLEEGDLACGPHEPMTTRGVRLAREAGVRISRLHNNCSGKHAAMLAHAVGMGWSTTGYEQETHAVQRGALTSVAEWTSMPESSIAVAVDGCGVSVYGMPLSAMARAYANLGKASRVAGSSAARIVEAMTSQPFLVGGTDRFDTVLMEETDGRVVVKVGAEGVHSLAVPELGIGAAIKVEDGALRAQQPALLRLLQILGVLEDELPPRLADFLERPVRNTRGEVVGEVRCAG
jgi:L-asparaginase II